MLSGTIRRNLIRHWPTTTRPSASTRRTQWRSETGVLSGTIRRNLIRHWQTTTRRSGSIRNNAAAFYKRGAVWFAKNESDEALVDYDEAIRLDPEHAKAFAAEAPFG